MQRLEELQQIIDKLDNRQEAETKIISKDDFLVKIGEFTRSNIDGYDKFVMLLNTFVFYTNREVNRKVSGNYTSSGRMYFWSIKIAIKDDVFVADILKKYFNGETISEIIIKRIMVDKGNKEIKEYKFKNCKIVAFDIKGDQAEIVAEYDQVDVKYNGYAQSDGASKGKNSASFDLVKGKLS